MGTSIVPTSAVTYASTDRWTTGIHRIGARRRPLVDPPQGPRTGSSWRRQNAGGSYEEARGMSVIEVEHLHKRYGNDVAVHDVSFSVEEGEIFGVLGPNGAGKTTTVECLSGLRPADRGRVSVLGLDPRADRDALRQVLGVQLQESGLPDKLKVREALDLYASFYERPVEVAPLMERLGLADKADTRFKNLSGGQKQRLAIALAMVGGPKVVILDEL